jgi:hypothetical protein
VHELIEKFTNEGFLEERKMTQDEIMQVLDAVGIDPAVQIFLRYQRTYQERDAAEKSLAKKTAKPVDNAITEDLDNVN